MGMGVGGGGMGMAGGMRGGMGGRPVRLGGRLGRPAPGRFLEIETGYDMGGMRFGGGGRAGAPFGGGMYDGRHQCVSPPLPVTPPSPPTARALWRRYDAAFLRRYDGRNDPYGSSFNYGPDRW